MRSNVTDIDVFIVHQTDKALLVKAQEDAEDARGERRQMTGVCRVCSM